MSSSWFRVGHTTHAADRTGCTAIIFDRSTSAIVDVRGGAPGTRETTLLDPGRHGRVDAIVLSGGSAFGLRAADGVMRWLLDQGRGLETPAGRVPLVPAAIIYDLAVGSDRSPTAEDGYNAAAASSFRNLEVGRLGAGTGATVAKLEGTAWDGGIGAASVQADGVTITAIVVMNSVGSVVNPQSGEIVAGNGPSSHEILRRVSRREIPPRAAQENTAIGCLMIETALSRDDLTRCGIAAHNGLARCVVPAHTALDGDTFFCCAIDEAPAQPGQAFAIGAGCQLAVESAILGLFVRNEA